MWERPRFMRRFPASVWGALPSAPRETGRQCVRGPRDVRSHVRARLFSRLAHLPTGSGGSVTSLPLISPEGATLMVHLRCRFHIRTSASLPATQRRPPRDKPPIRQVFGVRSSTCLSPRPSLQIECDYLTYKDYTLEIFP